MADIPTSGSDFLIGTSGPDTIDALSGNDTVRGGDGDDLIYGGDGNDNLVGGAGTDSLYGGAGADSYNVGDVTDTVDETVGQIIDDGAVDTVWSSVTFTLGTHLENLRLTGSAAIDGTGNDLANVITGTSAANVITGGAGVDTLAGKGGADTFAFAESGAANRDVIVDLDADDVIRLDASAFAGLQATGGVLDGAFFVTGTQATAGHAQVVYNATTGVLSYDADGDGAGAAQEIAVIGKRLDFVDASDLLFG